MWEALSQSGCFSPVRPPESATSGRLQAPASYLPTTASPIVHACTIMDSMSRFRRDDAPSLVRAARQDASLTQAELAGMTGMSQSTLAQIESGRRAVSAELLERILRAADYRPSVPLAHYASSISSYAQERGLGFLRVFGSVARGTDGFESDIDLIGTPTRELSLFELADIASFTSELTGFPTEVHADTHVPEALRAAIDEAVAL